MVLLTDAKSSVFALVRLLENSQIGGIRFRQKVKPLMKYTREDKRETGSLSERCICWPHIYLHQISPFYCLVIR